MDLLDLFGWLSLLGAAWFWYDSLRAREAAVAAAAEACLRATYQFLDDTVSIAKIGLARIPDGTLCVLRTYTFEYSRFGDDRRRGWVRVQGRAVVDVHVGLYVASGTD